jgi:hypothetical protein
MDLNSQISCNHIVGDPIIYYTLSTCPRCFGLGTYGGLSFTADGKLSTIQASSQLSQQIKKILTEKMRPSGYGFNYSLLSGVIDVSKLDAIQAEVYRCLSYLQNAQRQEVRSGHIYAGSEQISSIGAVSTLQSPMQPTAVQVFITVITVSGASISFQTSLQR